MKWILSILALVFAVEVHAQPSPINRRAMVISGLASSRFDPSSISGIRYRWNTNNLTGTQANSSNVVDWIDIVSLTHLTNSSANSPTNSTKGVAFFGTKWLGGTNASFNTATDSILFIINVAHSAAWQSLICDSATETGFMIKNDDKWWDTGTTGPNSVNLSGNVISLNVNQDLVLSADGKTYTNGVAALTGLTPAGVTFGFVGVNQAAHVDGLTGYIQEIIIWSNTTLSSVNASNLHYYRTNVYGGSP